MGWSFAFSEALFLSTPSLEEYQKVTRFVASISSYVSCDCPTRKVIVEQMEQWKVSIFTVCCWWYHYSMHLLKQMTDNNLVWGQDKELQFQGEGGGGEAIQSPFLLENSGNSTDP